MLCDHCYVGNDLTATGVEKMRDFNKKVVWGGTFISTVLMMLNCYVFMRWHVAFECLLGLRTKQQVVQSLVDQSRTFTNAILPHLVIFVILSILFYISLVFLVALRGYQEALLASLVKVSIILLIIPLLLWLVGITIPSLFWYDSGTMRLYYLKVWFTIGLLCWYIFAYLFVTFYMERVISMFIKRNT